MPRRRKQAHRSSRVAGFPIFGGPPSFGFLCERVCRQRKGDGPDAGKRPDFERMFNIGFPNSLKLLCFLVFDRPFYLICFFAPGSPNPLESLERRIPEVRKITLARNFSSLPAGRERRSTPGRRRAGSGVRWPGGLGGSNRRIEEDGVRPSSPMAHRAAQRMAERSRTVLRRFLRSLLFGGVGRPRQAHFGR